MSGRNIFVPLTDAQVTAIRTSGLTDAHFARLYRKNPKTIRAARTGETHKHVPTPPDTAPRDGGGRHALPKAVPGKVRR